MTPAGVAEVHVLVTGCALSPHLGVNNETFGCGIMLISGMVLLCMGWHVKTRLESAPICRISFMIFPLSYCSINR